MACVPYRATGSSGLLPFPHPRGLIYSGLILLATTPAAYGNAGLPLLPVACSGMLLALVSIALIEAFVICRKLSRPFGQSLKTSFAANGCSTVIGIPLTWAVLLLLELIFGSGMYGLETWQKRVYAVTAQAAWLIPYEEKLHWMVPAALVFMLIPFSFVSVMIEYGVIRRMWKDLPRRPVFSAVLIGNAITYALMAGYLLNNLRSALATHA